MSDAAARATPPAPTSPGPVRAAVEAAFAAAARLRGARPFHPRGAGFRATVRAHEDGALGWLGEEPRRALVRLSNSAGLPARWPDVYGLAVRIPDGSGGGRPLDLLLASSGEAPGVRHLLVPSRGFDVPRYSSLLLFRSAGRLLLVGARHGGPARRRPLRLADLEDAASDGGLRFVLAVASPMGSWREVAQLEVGEKLPPSTSASLRFHPWHAPPQLAPVGPLNHLRAGAYDAAQRTATSE
jgi:hypothetical protein